MHGVHEVDEMHEVHEVHEMHEVHEVHKVTTTVPLGGARSALRAGPPRPMSAGEPARARTTGRPRTAAPQGLATSHALPKATNIGRPTRPETAATTAPRR